MKKTIAVLAGDGIGPEIMEPTVKLLEKLGEKFGHTFTVNYALVGGDAYEKYGVHLPKEAITICTNADAILLGAVGGPVDDQESPKWKDAEKNVILGLRKKFNLFANLRPLFVWPGMEEVSPLKRERIKGVDILIVRELVSGIYFGERRQYEKNGERVAEDVNFYSWSEIERVIRVGFASAQKRRNKLTIVDKANVLETSRLWREVAKSIQAEFPKVAVDFMFVDNAAMQIVKAPISFDVIVTDNMFGDILSDLGGAVVGSVGLLPSASINATSFGMYEPIHGSAPKMAGLGTANPTSQFLSLSMLLRHSFGLEKEAKAIETAIISVWKKGIRTKDLVPTGEHFASTSEFGEQVIKEILETKE